MADLVYLFPTARASCVTGEMNDMDMDVDVMWMDYIWSPYEP